MATTTIKLNRKTKERLDKLKVTDSISYDGVIQEVLGILNLLKNAPYDAQERLTAIEVLRKKAVVKKGVEKDNV